MTHEALIPNRNRTDFIRVHHREEDLPVLREVWLGDTYHLNDHADEIKGRVCIDVGANIGCVALQLLDMGARHVFAVEPEPVNRDLAYANIIRNGYLDRVTLIAAAVGDPTITRTVFIEGTSGSAYSLDAPEGGGIGVADFTMVFERAVAELQDDETIAFLKVDVEGAEHPWFQTATTGQLERIDRIALEFHGSQGSPHLDADPDRYGRLLTKLAATHSVQVFGDPDVGGMAYAHGYWI